jgi:hypothetical protein
MRSSAPPSTLDEKLFALHTPLFASVVSAVEVLLISSVIPLRKA